MQVSNQLETKLIAVIKLFLIINLSSKRNVLIRIPFKLTIMLLYLTLRLIRLMTQKTKLNDTSDYFDESKSMGSSVPCQSSPASSSYEKTNLIISESLIHYNKSDFLSRNNLKCCNETNEIQTKNPLYSILKPSSSPIVNYLLNYNQENFSFNDLNNITKLEDLSSLTTNLSDYIKTVKQRTTDDNTTTNLNDLQMFRDSTDDEHFQISLESSNDFSTKKIFLTNNNNNNNNKNLVANAAALNYSDFKQQDQLNDSNKTKLSNETNARGNNSGLPDLINSKESDKARKYLEGLDGVKFNEIQVPDNLKKQLEYFDRDELLQLIAYQKKYLDFKESRIKDLENYIDNLVVKIIETEPLILMNASNVLTKSRNLI